LKEEGLEAYAPKFKENSVDGRTFLDLDEKMLTGALGIVDKPIIVMKLLKFIETSKAEEAEEDDEEEGDEEDES